MMHDAACAKLLEWYRDEILGEALFLELADAARDDREHAAKWRMLANLERCVQERLAAALTKRGVPLPDPEEDWQRGQAFAKPLLGIPWTELMPLLLPEGVKSHRAMQAAATSMPSDLSTLAQFVVAHEQALIDFMTSEIGGKGNESLEPVTKIIAEAQSSYGG